MIVMSFPGAVDNGATKPQATMPLGVLTEVLAGSLYAAISWVSLSVFGLKVSSLVVDVNTNVPLFICIVPAAVPPVPSPAIRKGDPEEDDSLMLFT